MRKLILIALVFGLLPLTPLHSARAAEELSFEEPSTDLEIESELAEEAPPRPEPPYPTQPAESNASTPPAPPPITAERPVRETEEGEYYYDTRREAPLASPAPGVETPTGTNKSDEFYYDTKNIDNSPTLKNVEQPVQISSMGEYEYHVEPSPMNRSASLRVAFWDPFVIRNRRNSAVTFKEIYGTGQLPGIVGDYEWRLSSFMGRLGIKLNSGLLVSQGKGRFLESNALRRSDDTPQEKLTFMLFPNQLTAIYKLQFAERQIVVPYIEGGGGYFTFIEARDDNKSPKLGGALTTVAAAGLNILLDWIDPIAIRQMDNEYGINHIWLTGEYRVIVGADSEIDFSSQAISGGVLVEF